MLNREHDLVSTVETFHAEYVPVIFVDDPMEAEHYRIILEAQDIPVLVNDLDPGEMRYSDLPRAIPVLVPEVLLDRASELVGRDEEAERQSPRMARDDDEDEAETEDEEDEDFDELDDEDDLDDAEDDFDDDDDDDFEDDDE